MPLSVVVYCALCVAVCCVFVYCCNLLHVVCCLVFALVGDGFHCWLLSCGVCCVSYVHVDCCLFYVDVCCLVFVVCRCLLACLVCCVMLLVVVGRSCVLLSVDCCFGVSVCC